MDKVNFKKELAELYNPKNTEWQQVDVPTMTFLMVDGKGDPNISPEYSNALEALYSVAYAIKLMSRKRWAGTTSSRRWRACGPPMIPPSSLRPTRANTNGQ
jgi:hypothetical protein